ncbi:response regulator [Oricola thermophila]|uniref:Response regulator n=1 Tax=Oricola thermophila TaxID=2742145 RepID=A0A6N1VH88_9HYPH|nr:response regulator [Oricola thermophila]QKV18519.1 response regulator [Oricola thermophila]
MPSGKSVLVVEDSAVIALDIEAMLVGFGATRIVTAGEGDAASTRQVTGEKFDLAIVDMRSVDGTAPNLVDELNDAGIPVVFLTTDAACVVRGGFAGLHTVVLKPFSSGEFYAAVARVAAETL